MSYTKIQLDKFAKRRIRPNRVWSCKKPNSDKPWVGIEIEFYTKHSGVDKILAASDIANYVTLCDDNSIDPYDYDNDDNDDAYDCRSYEIKICCPEEKITEVVGKVSSILKYIKAKTNSSCGLHVHVDHRVCTNRNPVLTFNNLIALQNVFFGVSKDHRKNCEYCEKLDSNSNFYKHLFGQFEGYHYDGGNRYFSVNLLSLEKYNTIEVRVFHSTINCREILHFVNLVLGATRSKKTIAHIKTKRSIDKIKTIPASTRAFVKKNCKLRRVA